MNTHAKQGKKTSEVERVIAAYHCGQNIFRRESVSPLIKYIGELEARLTMREPDALPVCVCPADGMPNAFCPIHGAAATGRGLR